jgi:hypothetical protein
MTAFWLLGIVLLVLYTRYQFTQIQHENELAALADGMCPRCYDGAYKSRCRACGGTGSADGFDAGTRRC